MALVHVKLDRFQEALDFSQSALDLLREVEDHLVEGVALTNMGLAFAGLGRFFRSLRSDKHLEDRIFNELSMGMSGDADLAIAQGSTMVRIGSAIFGERP